MDTAVKRIHAAIAGNEKVLIFGDYDVDGITSTVILLNFLRYVGADVTYYIPHRINEGYGIQPRHISHYASPNKVNLIITADCGSGSQQVAEAASKYGIDMIITDHHNISHNIPKALAVVNPKRHDCSAGLEILAGVGVVFCLLICLRTHLREKGFWRDRPEPNLKKYCDLVALGTVADMVPLVQENRIFCKTGLQLIGSGQRPGLAALLKASSVPEDSIDSETIAFRLAPRLNAAGRMDHAARAVNLLATEDIDAAVESAQWLNVLNKNRQELENRTLADIQTYLETNPSLLRQRSLVLSREGWHAGLLGIVAARVVEKYQRPVVLITTKDGMGMGSGRSVDGLNLYDALTDCKPFLENYGGHSMAAGLKIKDENIADFQNTFEAFIRRNSQPEDLIPTLQIESVLDFDAISDALIDELESLMPYGVGNPEPLFRATNVRVVSSKIVGKSHRRMILRQSLAPQAPTLQAIHFNATGPIAQKNTYSQIVFRLRWNRWNAKKSAQIVIEDLR
jgi:single-stranded-DNA-specific exonuclease